MIYSTRAAPTASATDDTDGTSATVGLNALAQRILYVGGYTVEITATVAEGRATKAFFSGDIGVPGLSPTSTRIPLGSFRNSYLVGADHYMTGLFGCPMYPVDWPTKPLGNITANTRGIGGTNAAEVDVFIIYSDGEAHPADPPIWGSARGLRGVPRYYVSPDFTTLTATTTETAATNNITVPAGASTLVGLSSVQITDGVDVAADESNTRVRYVGGGTTVKFDPDQIWPVGMGAYDAGLQGLAAASVDNIGVCEIDFFPLKAPFVATGTITANYTMRSSVTNAVRLYDFAAFA